MLFDSQFAEQRNFSDLHKIILQIRPGSIREELQRSTASLDTVDATGRSPLSWAAQRADAEVVEVLLEYGADPNNNDRTNMTPLHYAAQAKTPECLLVLIEHGARITQQARGWNALHSACAFRDNIDYIKPLLDRGIEINKRTYAGKSALSLAVLYNHTRSAAFLISVGAELNVLDKEGLSPLALSIIFKNLESLKLLLQSGATHEITSEGGDTLLHLVAKFPDVEIINYLSGYSLGNVDPDARNKEHLTARELMQIQNSDPNTALAFQKLLSRIAGTIDANSGKSPDFDAQNVLFKHFVTEIFEDAVEQQRVNPIPCVAPVGAISFHDPYGNPDCAASLGSLESRSEIV